MKSAFITLFILIILYVMLSYGALDIIKSSTFHYISVGALILVFAVAGIFIGFKPSNKNHSSAVAKKENTDEN